MIRRVPHVLDLGSRKFWQLTGRRVDLEGRERWLDAPVSLVDGGVAVAAVPDPGRHADAMAERDRRDFHHEFATFRFRAVSEHGAWQGRSGIVPTDTGR
jgi:hypothetical protein